MLYSDIVTKIERGMNDAKCAYDIKTEASFYGNVNEVYGADIQQCF